MTRQKIDLEFIFRASPATLYMFVTSPDCLVRWFADSCDRTGDTFTFEWEGSEEVATMIDDIEEERVRFSWEDSDEGEYLEFRFYKSDVTNETIFEITDFCDDDEKSETTDLWTSQVQKLRIECGG